MLWGVREDKKAHQKGKKHIKGDTLAGNGQPRGGNTGGKQRDLTQDEGSQLDEWIQRAARAIMGKEICGVGGKGGVLSALNKQEDGDIERTGTDKLLWAVCSMTKNFTPTMGELEGQDYWRKGEGGKEGEELP